MLIAVAATRREAGNSAANAANAANFGRANAGIAG